MMTDQGGSARTIVDYFEEQARARPDAPFIHFGGTRFSYGEIANAATRLTQEIAVCGVNPGDRVAIAISNRPAFLVALLGVLSGCATAVPLNVLYKPDEYRYALTHAACKVVLTENSLAPVLREACAQSAAATFVAGQESELEFAAPAGVNTSGPLPSTRSSDLAAIFYTSGTTSRPKGVMISHENLLYSAAVTIRSLALTPQDVPALAFPLFHVNSLFYGVLTAIVLGGSIGLLRSFSPSRYWDDVQQTGATWTPGITGPLIRLLLQQPPGSRDTAHKLRFAVGGGFLNMAELEEFTRRFRVRLLPGWSMTETVSLGTLHPNATDMPLRAISGIGYPTAGQEIRVVRDDGQDATCLEPGEMLYRTPSPFRGYLNDAEATRAAFTENGWFRTGDVARREPDGYLVFLDRKKEMIKSKGENVAAAEVERVLNEHPAVLESAVIGVKESEGIWGERVETWVVLRSGMSAGEQELMSWAAQKLADFKVPRAVHFVSALPKTALGKVQRQQLRLEQQKSSTQVG